MAWLILGAIIVFFASGVRVYLKLMDRAMQRYAVGLVDFLLLLVGSGILFVAGYCTARFGLGMSEQRSLFVGMAVPVAYAVGRLSWIALGLLTPWSDYERWRDQDHRDYWN